MKKLYFLTLIVLSSVFTASATHLMGGQITCQQVAGNMYEVKLTLYRDSVGVPIAASIPMKITHMATGSYTTLTIFTQGL